MPVPSMNSNMCSKPVGEWPSHLPKPPPPQRLQWSWSCSWKKCGGLVHVCVGAWMSCSVEDLHVVYGSEFIDRNFYLLLWLLHRYSTMTNWQVEAMLSGGIWDNMYVIWICCEKHMSICSWMHACACARVDDFGLQQNWKHTYMYKWFIYVYYKCVPATCFQCRRLIVEAFSLLSSTAMPRRLGWVLFGGMRKWICFSSINCALMIMQVLVGCAGALVARMIACAFCI